MNEVLPVFGSVRIVHEEGFVREIKLLKTGYRGAHKRKKEERVNERVTPR